MDRVASKAAGAGSLLLWELRPTGPSSSGMGFKLPFSGKAVLPLLEGLGGGCSAAGGKL